MGRAVSGPGSTNAGANTPLGKSNGAAGSLPLPSAPEGGGRADVSICPARTAPDGGTPGACAGGPAVARAGGDRPCD